MRGGETGSMGKQFSEFKSGAKKIRSGEIKSIFSDVCFRGNDSKQDNLYFQMPSEMGSPPRKQHQCY